jgi:hypothetical protein
MQWQTPPATAASTEQQQLYEAAMRLLAKVGQLKMSRDVQSSTILPAVQQFHRRPTWQLSSPLAGIGLPG